MQKKLHALRLFLKQKCIRCRNSACIWGCSVLEKYMIVAALEIWHSIGILLSITHTRYRVLLSVILLVFNSTIKVIAIGTS